MRFVGYSLTSKGYRHFAETNRKLYIRRDVEFNENDFGQKQALTTEPDQMGEDVKQNAGTTTKDEEEVSEMKKFEKEEEDTPQESRKSERTRKPPARYGYDEYAETATHRVHHIAYHLCEIDEPSTIREAKPVSTPADLNVKLQKEDGVSGPVDVISYQSIVGSLLYAAIATRPGIAQAVGVVSKFCANPTQSHFTAAKRILRYLKGTVSLGLSYKKCADGILTGYSDADWAGDVDDRHSTSGNVFSLARGAVSWLSKKQATVALSTAEAEYVALSTATQEAIWLRRLLTDVGEPLEESIVIHEDNQGAIAMAKNPVGHARTKHIDICYHFVREGV